MNITYLLGAGASANAIPPVDGMKECMRNLIETLSKYYYPNINEPSFNEFPFKLKENIKSIQEIVAEFDWLLKEAEKHNTFDTLAKKFYLTKDIESLFRLKRALVIYFTIIQLYPFVKKNITNSLIDKRYDSFIATVAERSDDLISLKKNIKVLTWNYDLQLELSLKGYVDQKIHELKENYQIFPNHNSFEISSSNLIDFSQFAMVKLNGNAFFDNPSETGEEYKSTLFDTFYKIKSDKDFLGELAYQYKWLHANNEKLVKDAVRYLNFAWESDSNFQDKYPGHANNINEAIKVAANTQILVVIGYSFPIFNREIDKEVFKNMVNLKKVYIQDKDPEKIKSTIENAFEVFQPPFHKGKSEKSFQLEKNTDQFIIPYEL